MTQRDGNQSDTVSSDSFGDFLTRASIRAQGFDRSHIVGKPLIGIFSGWNELARCHLHFRGLTEAIARGVWQAGGFPREIPTMPIAADVASPTGISFMHRNLLAMQIEEVCRVYPLDGVVMVGACDESLPAMLMAAATADLPCIVLPGGPGLNGRFRGECVGSSTDCHRFFADWRAGVLSDGDLEQLEGSIDRSHGHCTTMGTASTMACLTEALGMGLPGSAAIPAVDSRRLATGQRVGQAIVDLTTAGGPTPRELLTRPAFENAIRVLGAVAGSTNAVMHLLALAGRSGVDLSLPEMEAVWAGVPTLANLKPSGTHLMEDFFHAGGVPALLRQMAGLLDLSARAVSGVTLQEVVDAATVVDDDVIRPLERPVYDGEALVVLTGSLAPTGAVLKQSAASSHLRRHEGRARVFDSYQEMTEAVSDPSSEFSRDDVLVLRNGGPRGAPGMPEWGSLPMPVNLLREGVRDMVRVSDSRMSGTAFGTNIVHVSPEAYVGGPLALVRDGDWIDLDVPGRRLDLRVSEQELAARARERRPTETEALPGYPGLYRALVSQASEGCDFTSVATGELRTEGG